jgi:type IV pilus assembly protein PilW
MRFTRRQSGFSLIELMISLVLGLLISSSVIQVMISNNMSERLNRAVASAQENGRFIVSRLRNDILMTGRYDPLSPALNTDIDIVEESTFVKNNPVPVVGDFVSGASIGAKNGTSGGSDTLVVAMQASQDCRGNHFGYAEDEEFFVVNEYFLDNTSLKCRGFDGRVLRGQQGANLNDSDNAYTLLDDVYSFQVQYGMSDVAAAQDNSARPVKFIDASTLDIEKAAGSQVVAIRIALLIKADSNVIISPVPSFKLLNENAIQPTEERLFKQFETTITLRNSKNFIRSRNI